jgi:hypothetical protein
MVDLPKQNALNLSEVPKPTLHNYLPQGNEALHQHLLGLAGKVRNSAALVNLIFYLLIVKKPLSKTAFFYLRLALIWLGNKRYKG